MVEATHTAPSEDGSMRDQTQEYRGSSVSELPRANRTYPTGRVCADPGCSTRLSMYNRSDLCWQHEPVRPYVERGERRKRAAA